MGAVISAINEWHTLQNVQTVRIPLDCVMRKERSATTALARGCAFTLLAGPQACRLLSALVRDRDRKAHVSQGQGCVLCIGALLLFSSKDTTAGPAAVGKLLHAGVCGSLLASSRTRLVSVRFRWVITWGCSRKHHLHFVTR